MGSTENSNWQNHTIIDIKEKYEYNILNEEYVETVDRFNKKLSIEHNNIVKNEEK